MDLNIPAILVLATFYLLVFVIGIVAARKVKFRGQNDRQINTSFVAGRDLNVVVGAFSMIATTVGGGYINGTAESIVKQGLVWTLAPFGIFIGLNIGGLVFAKRMRDEQYITLLDPMQEKYGNVTVGLVYLASLCGDLFWSASILSALGTTLSVIINLDLMVAIITSAAITVCYTMIGQIIAVAYTDVAQLSLITIGLMLCIPFILTNERCGDFTANSELYLGSLDKEYGAVWGDLLLAMTFGTIPWQAYFQRVLSAKSGKHAQILSFIGAFGALLLAIPPVLIGAVAVNANWTGTVDNKLSYSIVLPLVLREFTPPAVSIIGLGALSAAVMSSMDSSILGCSTMFSHNIYRHIIRKEASDRELLIVQRIAVIIVGALVTLISIQVTVIYNLFTFAADLVYVTIFPQLVCSLFFQRTNGYGSIFGFLVGSVLRIGAGESLLFIETTIYYPFYDPERGQLFPFRTFAMLISFLSIVIISEMFRFLFAKNILPSKFDLLQAVKPSQRYSMRTYSTNEQSPIHPKEDSGISMKDFGNRNVSMR